LLRMRLCLEEYDYFIQYISGSKNINADAMSRIRLITRQKTMTFPKMEQVTFQESKNILLLTSEPKLRENNFFNSLTIELRKKGEFEAVRLDKRLVIIVFYRSTKKETFLRENFLKIIESVRALIDKFNAEKKHQIKSLSVYDDYESISNFGSPQLERDLNLTFQPIKLAWLKLNRTPKEKLSFIKNMHEHKLTCHPGKEKL